MPKTFLKDILPSERGRIAEIKMSDKKEDKINLKKISSPIDNDVFYYKDFSSEKMALNNSYKKIKIWILAILAILVLAVSGVFYFSRTEIVVIPKVEKMTLNSSFVIGEKDCGCNPDLFFEKVIKEKMDSAEVVADSEKEVERKATGKIIVFNNYSKISQRLIKNTRFKAPNGLIYKIDQSIEIPGYTEKDGKKIPGEVEATVFASFPGVEYNLGLVNFTIPGFESNKERYENFYAKSKTEMTDGFVGKVKVVSDNKMNQARLSLRSKIEAEVRKELEEQYAYNSENNYLENRDDYYVFPPNLIRVYFESGLTDDLSLKDKILINEKVKILVFSFKFGDLEKAILDENLLLDKNMYLKDTNGLIFDIDGLSDDFEKNLSKKYFDIDIKGEVFLVHGFDVNNFKQDISGLKKAKIGGILEKNYSNSIENINILSKPFWLWYIPDEIDKIKVQIGDF